MDEGGSDSDGRGNINLAGEKKDSLGLASTLSPTTTHASLNSTISSFADPASLNTTGTVPEEDGKGQGQSFSSTIASFVTSTHLNTSGRVLPTTNPSSRASSRLSTGGYEILVPLLHGPLPREELIDLLSVALNPTLPVIPPEEEEDQNEDGVGDAALDRPRGASSSSSSSGEWVLRCRLVNNALSALDSPIPHRRSSSGLGAAAATAAATTFSSSSSSCASWVSPLSPFSRVSGEGAVGREGRGAGGAFGWRKDSSGAVKQSRSGFDPDTDCVMGGKGEREGGRKGEKENEHEQLQMAVGTLREENEMLRYRLAEVEGSLGRATENVRGLQRVRRKEEGRGGEGRAGNRMHSCRVCLFVVCSCVRVVDVSECISCPLPPSLPLPFLPCSLPNNSTVTSSFYEAR